MQCAYQKCDGESGTGYDVYRIVDRGSPFDGKEFCCCEHAEKFVTDETQGLWEVCTEDFSRKPKAAMTVHALKLQETKHPAARPIEAREAGAT